MVIFLSSVIFVMWIVIFVLIVKVKDLEYNQDRILGILEQLSGIENESE
jgi:hypothetical protein